MEEHKSLNMKDMAAIIANQMLQEAWKIVVEKQKKQVVEFARKWGAQIATEQEDQAINDLKEFFEQPTSWPSIQVSTAAPGLTTSTAAPAPRGRKQLDSDTEPKPTDANKRKATDYGELKLPEGREPITCPVEVKSGDRKGLKCGKVCKRVTDAHDAADPKCAKFECGHMFCGQHIVKASGMDTSAARKRLEKASDSDSGPVTMNEDGKETVIASSSLGTLKPEQTTAAAKQTVSKIFDMVKKRKEAASGVSNDNNQ
uniref:Uncharacterized protein n=1 Tax=viral metagenome TaxID=1070528 RepID=A0A6C0CIC5_9ZZZZ